MKRITTLAVFVVIVFIGGRMVGQVYQPFPVSNARWSEKVELENHIIPWDPDTTHGGMGWCYALGNDTIIGAHHYTLVGSQQTWDYYFHNSGWGTVNNYGVIPPGQIFGAIREDSSKKVWFRKLPHNPNMGGYCFYPSSLPLDSDILLYDFDLQVGDSLPWTTWFSLGTKKVIAIDSVQYDDSIWRKRYRLWPLGEYWVEGIGCTLGLFGALIYPDLPCRLSCFWQNGEYDIVTPQSIYDFCDSVFSPVGIENVASSKESFSLSPNPFTTQLQIHYTVTQPGELMVYDALGRKVKSYTLAANQNTIELSLAELPAGVYLVEVESGGRMWSEKVVKE